MNRKITCIVYFTAIVLLSACSNGEEDKALYPKQDNKTGKWGYVDDNEKEIVPFRYDEAQEFSDGMAKVSIDGKNGFINKKGKMVIKPQSWGAGNFHEGMAWVISGDTYGYIDKSGKEVIPLKYHEASDFSGGLAKVGLGVNSLFRKYGFIDRTGKEVTPIKYDYVDDFSEGYAVVRIGDLFSGKYGYIDSTGNEIIPLKYDKAENFSEGLAMVGLHHQHKDFNYNVTKCGFIDKTGKEVIPPEYESAGNFSGGLARVRLRSVSDYAYINYFDNYVDKAGALELCKEPLMTYIRQINDFRAKLNRSSQSSGILEINRPYLLITANSNKCEDISFKKYSEEIFNEHSISELKTLIIQYEYFGSTSLYGINNQIKTARSSYGTYIIYFDMERKECIGFDNLQAPDNPETASVSVASKINWSDDDIIKKIESRLKTLP